jgi:hypothetical protein
VAWVSLRLLDPYWLQHSGEVRLLPWRARWRLGKVRVEANDRAAPEPAPVVEKLPAWKGTWRFGRPVVTVGESVVETLAPWPVPWYRTWRLELRVRQLEEAALLGDLMPEEWKDMPVKVT